MRRVLPLLLIVALAGCGSSHHAHPKYRLPPTPVLSTLLAKDKSVHFAVAGTATIKLDSILSHLQHVPPFRFHAKGDASCCTLEAVGAVQGAFSGTGRAIVYGPKGYARAGGKWYALGNVAPLADLMRSVHWAIRRGSDRKPRSARGQLHLSTGQLEQLSGLSIPFGVDGADVHMTIHLSNRGELIEHPIRPPRHALPLPRG